jgi:hypothetical protein
MNRPPEARGQRSGYQRNGVQQNNQEFSQTCQGILEDIRSPLSYAAPSGNTHDHDDDLFGGPGLGVAEHNFKSQTL